MESLTERLRTKLELTYDGIWDTPHSFQYLTRFKTIIFIFFNNASNSYRCWIHFLPGLKS